MAVGQEGVLVNGPGHYQERSIMFIMRAALIFFASCLADGACLRMPIPRREGSHMPKALCSWPHAARFALTAPLIAQPLPVMALDFDFARDPVDAYYGLVALVGLVYVVQQTAKGLIDDAKDYDRRGELANAMAKEAKKREREARRQDVLESEPETLRRMEAEKKQRGSKREGWKFFPDDEN